VRKAWLDVDPCRRSGTGHPGCVWVRDLGHTPPPIRVMSGFEILAARRYRTQMPLPNQVLRELEEFDAAAVPVDLLTIFQKLSIGLDERNSPTYSGADGTALNTCCTGPDGEDGISSMRCAVTIESVAHRFRSSIYNCSTKSLLK